MAIEISAKILGDRELVQTLARLSAHDIPKAIRDGVRDASRSAKTVMGKEMAAASPVPSSRIKADLKVSIQGAGDIALVNASSKPISAQRFRPTQLKNGLRLTLYKGHRTLIPSGFRQPTRKHPGAGKLAFKPTSTRTYTGDQDRAKPRKGMEFVQGLSVASMYLGGMRADTMQPKVEERIAEQLEKGIIRSLGGMGRGFGKAR